MPLDRLKRLRFALASPRMLAFVPVLVLGAYLLGGETALVVVAIALAPLTALVVGWQQPLASGHQRDPLSDLILRDGLIDWVDRALPRAARDGFQAAVIVLTIDDLDTVYDRFGQAFHDSVLLEAIERIKALLRDEDVFARVGQSVAIGLDNIRIPETESLSILVNRIKAAFEEPFGDGPTRTFCTVSMGIAAEGHVKSPSGANIVAGAQRANELAAFSGAGSVRFYSGGLSSEDVLDRATARELHNALETNEIFAWFQPQVRLADGKVIGFEALARWDHPERGLIAPASFLSDILKAGLSQRLAEVILKQALMALSTWDEAGFDVPCVSVNFDVDELRNPRLADYVRWELDRHGIAPERLVIEVLESVASESSEDAVSRTLQSLSLAGCRIDLDDFGTGFSSFSNVRRFNVDRIKIDRSLVNKLDTDPGQLDMFAAILAFGKRLGIDTLAEGVETEGELDSLRSLGCPDAQGYVISRPLPLGETLNWLEETGGDPLKYPMPEHRDTA